MQRGRNTEVAKRQRQEGCVRQGGGGGGGYATNEGGSGGNDKYIQEGCSRRWHHCCCGFRGCTIPQGTYRSIDPSFGFLPLSHHAMPFWVRSYAVGYLSIKVASGPATHLSDVIFVVAVVVVPDCPCCWTGGVAKTRKKVKRGVNEVKDTVKDTVKDLGKGVGESVGEVADALKVRHAPPQPFSSGSHFLSRLFSLVLLLFLVALVVHLQQL